MEKAVDILHDANARWGEELPQEVRNHVAASVRFGVRKQRYLQHLEDRGNATNRQQKHNRIADMKDKNLMGEFKGFVWPIDQMSGCQEASGSKSPAMEGKVSGASAPPKGC